VVVNGSVSKSKPVISSAPCTGFEWEGSGSGRDTEMASVRSCQKLPLCLIEPVPAGSRTDPSLAKTKPISNGGSPSVITYLRRIRKP